MGLLQKGVQLARATTGRSSCSFLLEAVLTPYRLKGPRSFKDRSPPLFVLSFLPSQLSHPSSRYVIDIVPVELLTPRQQPPAMGAPLIKCRVSTSRLLFLISWNFAAGMFVDTGGPMTGSLYMDRPRTQLALEISPLLDQPDITDVKLQFDRNVYFSNPGWLANSLSGSVEV